MERPPGAVLQHFDIQVVEAHLRGDTAASQIFLDGNLRPERLCLTYSTSVSEPQPPVIGKVWEGVRNLLGAGEIMRRADREMVEVRSTSGAFQ
jgi:hypothetical protein